MIFGPAQIINDSMMYQIAAQRLVHTGVYEFNNLPTIEVVRGASAYVMPGYTLFLSLFYLFVDLSADVTKNTQTALTAIIAVQFALAVLTAVCISISAFFLAGKRASVLAGLIASAYIPIGINAMYVGLEAFALFLTSLAVLLLCGFMSNRHSRYAFLWAAAFGACFGLLVLTRSTLIFWIIIPLVLIAIQGRQDPKKTIVSTALIIGAFCLIMSPWIARNAFVYNSFVPLSSAMNDPLLVSTGSRSFSPEEQLLADEAVADGRDPFTVVAFYRLSERWNESPVEFLKWRAQPAITSVLNPTNMPLVVDVSYHQWRQQDNFYEVQGGLTVPPARGYSLLDSDFSNMMNSYMLTAHRILLIMFLLGSILSLVVRNSQQLMLASIPIYLTLIHFLILSDIRYLYYNVPSYIIIASAGIVFLCTKITELTRSLKGKYSDQLGAE